MRKLGLCILILILNAKLEGQISSSGCNLNGGMSLGNLCNNGCLSGCDLTAYNPFGTPQCNGTQITGDCSPAQTISTSYTIPAGCTANGTAEFRPRIGCGSSGADAGDFLQVSGTGGTSTGLPYNQVGASNANLTSTFTKTGGTLLITCIANRRDEIVTWTITLSGTCGPNCNQVLPITLTEFNAIPNEGYINLKWFIATEYNVESYTVEKSTDGLNFKEVATVKSIAAEAGGNNLSYSASDYSPENGINYYRLSHKEKSGEIIYSKTILLNYNQKSNQKVWVNQTESDVIISYENYFKAKQFYLCDANGKIIKPFVSNIDVNYTIINKNTLPKGLYVLRSNEGNMVPQKILIN